MPVAPEGTPVLELRSTAVPGVGVQLQRCSRQHKERISDAEREIQTFGSLSPVQCSILRNLESAQCPMCRHIAVLSVAWQIQGIFIMPLSAAVFPFFAVQIQRNSPHAFGRWVQLLLRKFMDSFHMPHGRSVFACSANLRNLPRASWAVDSSHVDCPAAATTLSACHFGGGFFACSANSRTFSTCLFGRWVPLLLCKFNQ